MPARIAPDVPRRANEKLPAYLNRCLSALHGRSVKAVGPVGLAKAAEVTEARGVRLPDQAGGAR